MVDRMRICHGKRKVFLACAGWPLQPSEYPMSEILKVDEPAELLAFLLARLQGWSRNTVKQRLHAGLVRVNGVRVVRHDRILQAGDSVEVAAAVGPDEHAAGLEILYADPDLIAVDKPAGLLAVGTTDDNRQNALAILRRQLARRARDVRLWPVHRIDRDTSGVLLFATSRAMREAVMERWGEAEKIYLAVVEGRPEPPRGTIDQPLRPDAEIYQMHVGDHPDARPAVTHYATEQTVRGRSLVRVWLETGRQHQIRAHLSWLGCPVVGDPRYGRGGGRMGLHALRLAIHHPVTGQRMVFEAPVPDDFLALLPPPRAHFPGHD